MNFSNEIDRILSVYNKMKIIVPEREVNLIYHYTSSEGLKGIIEESKLRFSDRNYLNDASEGIYVLDLLINNIDMICENSSVFKENLVQKSKSQKEKLISSKFHTYQCSFSTDEDSLCLWNYYTKGDNVKGYNIGFSLTRLIDSLIPKKDGHYEAVIKPIHGEVLYNEKKQLNIIKNMLPHFQTLYDEVIESKDMVLDLLIEKIVLQGMFFKKPCFGIEKEYRVIFYSPLIKNMINEGFPDKEELREYKGYFIPYIEKVFNPNSIQEIKVSPTLDYILTNESLKRLLGKRYSHVKITESNIPIRI